MPVASIARRLQTARRLPVIGLFAASALFTAGAGAQPSLSPQQLTALMGAVTPWDDAYDLSSPGQQRVTTEQPMLTSGLADLTRGAVQRYQAIVNAGGWPTVPGGTTLRIGSVHPSVVILRERLRITGDLVPIGGDIMTFDSLVDAAVRRFQRRHGLNEDGVVGGETLTQLNVPATVRLAQLQANLDRVGSLPRPTAARYVVVNIPGAEIETVENGLIHSRHEAVVGQVERETPILSSAIHQINFHPYWTVPRSIIERDLIPLVQEDPNYLEDNLIGIYNWSTGAEIDPTSIDWTTNEAVDYLIRQEPSDINALGSVRINFHNPYSVYLHDTPSKGLFGEEFRFHSSGCVRVQNVRELVAWLLESTPGWSRDRVDDVLAGGERLDVALGANVPIYTVYVTAWATAEGVVNFRSDIYGRDGLA